MKFDIDFNHFDDKNNTKEFYEFIGAKLVNHSEHNFYEIELNSFEEMAELMKKINQKCFNNDFSYSAVVNFEAGMGSIYLDDKC